MSHLTEEQFEDILQGAPVPAHIDECSQCQAALAEKRALAERLRKAFTSIEASPELAGRLRANLKDSSAVDGPSRRSRTILLAARHRLWSALAAAAVILLVALPIGLYLSTGSQAEAAQKELVEIHKLNLESLHTLFVHDDPRELANHMENETGHAPAMICTGPGLKVCGCCTRQFQGRKVGSYVVESSEGPISIVVMPEPPHSLGMRPRETKESSERMVWQSTCEGCNIASVRMGNLSYYAMGEVSHEDLDNALNNLL